MEETAFPVLGAPQRDSIRKPYRSTQRFSLARLPKTVQIAACTTVAYAFPRYGVESCAEHCAEHVNGATEGTAEMNLRRSSTAYRHLLLVLELLCLPKLAPLFTGQLTLRQLFAAAYTAPLWAL